MFDTRTIKHVRQDIADTNRSIAAKKVEARALMALAADQRPANYESALTAFETDLDALTATSAQLETEHAQALKFQEDERALATFEDDDADRAPSGRPAGRKFAQMFPGVQASMRGWGSASEFMAVVGRGLHDNRLQAGSMSTGSDSAGGFAVPEGILAPWLDQALENEIVRSRAAVWPMTSSERTVPAWDISDRSGDDLAGFEIQWVPELGEMNPQVGQIRRLKLHALKGAILAEASEELRADGMDFDQQISMIMIKALSYGLDRSFLFGAGTNQPLGVFQSSALITVAKESGQGAATIVYNNLLKMFARMPAASIPNSVWLAHPSTIPQLSTLSISFGVAGSHVPVMSESDGQFKILTRPVIFSEKVKTLGTLGDIGLFDFSQYTIGLRSDATIDRSQHAGFARDVMTYRLKIRLDGMPNLSGPIVMPNGAPTMSPFVTLAARG